MSRPRRKQETHGAPGPGAHAVDRAGRWLRISSGEWKPFGLSFLYFFLLLAAYYTLRPVRDALAAGVLGASDTRYAFLSTFVVMLALVPVFGAVAARVARRNLIPVVYLFFIANIVAWHWLFDRWLGSRALALTFFVWLSVFNLFVISVFWSFMADIYHQDQARRLFGPVAAGGSIGAIVGPLLPRFLAEPLGVSALMLISAGLLAAALGCMLALRASAPRREAVRAEPMAGGAMAGAQLAFRIPFLRVMTGFMLLGTFTGSLLYLQQLQVVGELSNQTGRLTAFFAGVDLTINILALLIQLVFTARILDRLGFPLTLALLPVVAVAGFGILAAHPRLWLIVAVQVLRRSTLFAITNPVSQMLFTAVGPESKYKFKSFLDTVVYRAGDTAGSWLFATVYAAGGLVAVSAVGLVAAGCWVVLAMWLGRRYLELKTGSTNLP